MHYLLLIESRNHDICNRIKIVALTLGTVFSLHSKLDTEWFSYTHIEISYENYKDNYIASTYDLIKHNL